MDNTLKYNFVIKVINDTKGKKISWNRLEERENDSQKSIIVRKKHPIPTTLIYRARIGSIGNLYLYKDNANYAYLVLERCTSYDGDNKKMIVEFFEANGVYEAIYEKEDEELNILLLRLYNIVDDMIPRKTKTKPTLDELMSDFINNY